MAEAYIAESADGILASLPSDPNRTAGALEDYLMACDASMPRLSPM